MPAEHILSKTTRTTVTPTRGGLVHITSLEDTYRTHCNVFCSGWKLATTCVTCPACEDAAPKRFRRPRR